MDAGIEQSIIEGLLEESEARDIAHDYRSLTATQFLQKYSNEHSSGQWALEDGVVELIDQGLESLIFTPR